MPPSIRPRTSPSREHARETEADGSKATKNMPISTASAPTADNLISSTTSPLYSSGIYGPGMGASMYGMGGGMYGAGGMMGSPYSYGGGGMLSMGGGPISNINQFLFSVQNIIFSLSQAVQVRDQHYVCFACVFCCLSGCTLSLVLIFFLYRLWE
jgi:hypothetical protein